MPDKVEPPYWQPLFVENPYDCGHPRLPNYINKDSPIELFRVFWDNEVIERIAEYTNLNAANSLSKIGPS